MHTNGYVNGTAQQVSTERLPPHNIEAEQSVLGSILIDNDAIYEVSGLLEHTDFYIGDHGSVFKAMIDLNRQNTPIDLITIEETLRARGRETLHGHDTQMYLVDLLNTVPTSLNVRHYGKIVKALATRRKLIRAANQIATAAYDHGTNIDNVVEQAERHVFEVTDSSTVKGVQSAKEGMALLYDATVERKERGGEPTGLKTGFVDLDRILGGLNKGDVYVLAGRPGMGKSSLERGIVLNVAKNGGRVASFNLEMPYEQVWQRTVALEGRIDFQNVRYGRLVGGDEARFNEAVGAISSYRMWVDDTPSITLTQLISKCRRIQAEHGLDLVTIDYMQLMTAERMSGNRTQEVGEISRGLKRLAKSLDVPVLPLAQLSRAVESRADKHPQLSDLRDSGEIEQDADVVMFLYRDEYYYPNETERPNVAELNIAKHRNGKTGEIDLYFHKEQIRFANYRADHINL